MDSSAPFYKQLNVRLFGIFAVVTFAISCALALLHYRDQQVTTLIENQVPEIERVVQQQSNYIKINQLLDRISASKNSLVLYQLEQEYITALTLLKSGSKKFKRAIEQSISAENRRKDSIKKLADNHQRNVLLQQNSLTQLQLVLDELSRELTDKSEKQQKLFTQITQDKVADSVTTSRAKAHAKLTQSLELLRKTEVAVNNVYVLFSRLNIQYPLEEYNYFTDELSSIFSLWQPRFNNKNKADELEKPLNNVFFELESLLLSEQNAIAKWRGHLRVSQEYVEWIAQQQSILSAQLEKLSLPQQLVTPLPKIVELLPYEYSSLTLAHLRMIIIGVFVFILLIIFTQLRRLRLKVKRHSNDCIALAEQTLSRETDSRLIVSSEEGQRLKTLLSSVVSPEHTEKDYQTLTNVLSHLHQSLFTVNLAFFDFNQDLKIQKNHFAKTLVFGGENKADFAQHISWRKAFNHENSRIILQCAKKAKAESSAQTCEVFTASKQQLIVTVWLENGYWQGIVQKQNLHEANKYQVDELTEQLSLQANEQQLALSKHTNHLSSMLIYTMLQCQNASINSETSLSQIYRQLVKILEWNTLLQAELPNKINTRITLRKDVNIRHELAAFCQNIDFYATQTRNTVQLQVDDNVLHYGNIDIELFHQTLGSLSRLCLHKHIKSSLSIKVEAIDKNSGQQIVRFSFSVMTDKALPSLPDDLQAIVSGEATNTSTYVRRFLHTQLTITHCSNVQATTTEKGFQLTIDMPVAFADKKDQPTASLLNIKFDAQRIILFVQHEDNPIESFLTSELRGYDASVISCQTAGDLTKAFSASAKASSPIVAIVFSLKDKAMIESFIENIDPSQKPKQITLQNRYTKSLHNEGLYEQCLTSLQPKMLIEYIYNVLQESTSTNALLSADDFKSFQFIPSQVQMLLAVENPTHYQNFIRLMYWFGLQVHVVCHEEIMTEYWKTGRYLLLMSEFSPIATVNFQVGNKIHRGVFNLHDIDNKFDIQQLASLLSPWLHVKSKATEQIHLTQKPTMQHSLMMDKSKPLDNTVDNTSPSLVDMSETLNKQTILVEEGELLAFDLSLYAANQGSPELAVFMLDDYVADIAENIEILLLENKAGNIDKVIEKTRNIQTLSAILAAKELEEMSIKLINVLQSKSNKHTGELINQLTSRYQALKEFSQAI